MSVVWAGGGRERWRCAVCGAAGAETTCRVCGVEMWASERLAAVLKRDLGVEALPDTPPVGPSEEVLAEFLESQIAKAKVVSFVGAVKRRARAARKPASVLARRRS